jgi:hypothetical protein
VIVTLPVFEPFGDCGAKFM